MTTWRQFWMGCHNMSEKTWWVHPESLGLQYVAVKSSYQTESEQRTNRAWRNLWWFAVSWGRRPLPSAAADSGCRRSGAVSPAPPSERPPSSRQMATPEYLAEDNEEQRKIRQQRVGRFILVTINNIYSNRKQCRQKLCWLMTQCTTVSPCARCLHDHTCPASAILLTATTLYQAQLQIHDQ